jgi:hypothetical protein
MSPARLCGIKQPMGLTNDVVAAWVLALVSPAVLFVTALCLRQVLPRESAAARTAERIVRWYAAHPQLALWVFLLLLPLSAFVLGSAALLRTWGDNPQLQHYTWRALAAIPAHWPAVSIGGGTLLSAGVLVMIAAHLMAGQVHRRRSVSQ